MLTSLQRISSDPTNAVGSILSPPASPYPDLSSLQQYMKQSSTVGKKRPYCSSRASPASSVGATPEVEALANVAAATPENDAMGAPTNAKGAKMVTCWESLLSDPSKYYERERNLLSLYPVHKQTWSNYIYVENSSEGKARKKQRVSRARRTVTYSGADTDSDAMLASRRTGGGDASSDAASDSDSSKRTPKKRSPAANSNSSRVHDLNIAQIEDFSPSCNILPPGRSLRAEWKGAPMDLSNDPDVHLLHPAEMHLASVLRLPAEVYLDSKRRLFAEKVHRMRQGLAFRRTDSQKACRIDVNKASRLFGAFERVGWLEDELFTKHL